MLRSLRPDSKSKRRRRFVFSLRHRDEVYRLYSIPTCRDLPVVAVHGFKDNLHDEKRIRRFTYLIKSYVSSRVSLAFPVDKKIKNV